MITAEYIIGGILPYVATGIFLLSMLLRIRKWAGTPHPVKWALYPMPEDVGGQVRFMAREILTFRSVWENNRPLWIGSFPFHASMALIVLWFVVFVADLHPQAGLLLRGSLVLMAVTCLYLLAFRILDSRMRAVTSGIEIFNILVFLGMAVMGLALLCSARPGGPEFRAYFLGLVTFSPVEPPASPLFLGMLALTEFFLIYFPNSRMLHMVSKYFTFHNINWQHH
jgi:nitrate reductase gamma subunit